DAPGRVGNLLAADLHRSIGLSAAPPSLWPGRELRKYHCLEVPGGCLFTFQGPQASGLSSSFGGDPCCDFSLPASVTYFLEVLLPVLGDCDTVPCTTRS